MSRQVLGKRSHSSLSSSPSRSPTPAPKSRRASVALELPSPDPTPNPKRVKTCASEVEEYDGSNKENIPPDPVPGASNLSDDARDSSLDASPSTTTMTARELRASRRASTTYTRSIQTARRRTSSSRAQSPTTSSDHISVPPSISQSTYTPRAGAETPSKSISRPSLVTPPSTPASMPPPQSCTNEVTSLPQAATLHTTLRASLRPQANGSTPLVGREHERHQILSFLTPFLAGDSQCVNVTSLYISGAPGTGKTALVSEVLDTLVPQGADMDANNAPLRVLYLNCMSLGVKDGMAGVWERCVEHFGNEKAKKRVTATKVDWSERFGSLLRGKKCILVLDEIDHLATSSSVSISEIFSLAADPLTSSSLRVIGISNTHTLTHSKPAPHCKTIHFQPYTSAQMKSILGKRLESLSASGIDSSKVFPPSTIALLAFKIANETGDIRTVFSVARRALDLATVGSPASSVTVTPAHVLAALKASNTAMNTSQSKRDGGETVTRVRNLGLHSRFVLAALLLAARRISAGLSLTGTSSGSFKENTRPSMPSFQGRDAAQPAIEMTALHCFYVAILSRGDHGAFHGVGRTEFGDLVGLLEGSGLVEMAQGRGFGSKTKSPVKAKGTQTVCVSRGVREEELVRGLVGSPIAEDAIVNVNVSEEEVKSIWEREMRRLDREVKARLGNAAKRKADFDDAEED